MTEQTKKRDATIKRMVVAEARRMYDGGNVSRLTQSWDTTPWTADQVIYTQLENLRSRAREQARNNDYVPRLQQILQNNVVGATGFKLRSQVIDLKGKTDELPRKVIEAAWQEFTESVDLVEIEQLLIAAMPTDGEALLYMTELGGQLHVELIDPARLDVNFNRSKTENQTRISMGIEYDDHNRPLAYHIDDDYRRYHPSTGAQTSSNIPRTRIPATNMLHIFRKVSVAQSRGIPWIAHSLTRLFQLGRYEDAAITAARIGAAKMGFFSSEDDDEYTGDGSSGDMQINAEAGTFENIGSMNFHTFDPTYPAGEFKTFMERTLKGISSGMGVDYHSLANDLSGVNYSSARVGMLETREYFKTLQGWMVAKCIRPLFQQWLKVSLFHQTLKISTRPLSRGFDYYKPALFVGRRWEWVDPQKEAMGKKLQYDMRTLSLSQIIRERGDDPDTVFNEIAEEKAKLMELGITPDEVLTAMGDKDSEQKED